MPSKKRSRGSEATPRSEATEWVGLVKDRLRATIAECGLSHREVARRMGHGPAYLSNLFLGIRGRAPAALRLDTLYSVLRVVGVSPVDFLGSMERPRQRALADVRAGATRRPLGGGTAPSIRGRSVETALTEPRSLARHEVSLEVQTALRKAKAEAEAARRRSGLLKRKPRRP